MTKKIIRPDYKKYEFGALASHLLSSKERPEYIKGSLDELAGKRGLNLGEEAEGFVKGTYASEEGIQEAIRIYDEKFNAKRGELQIKDLLSDYSNVLKDLDKNERDVIVKTLSLKEKLSTAKEKAGDASMIYAYFNQRPNGKLFTTDQREKATKTLQKYRPVLDTIRTLDNYALIERLRPYAVEAARVPELKGLAKKLSTP